MQSYRRLCMLMFASTIHCIVCIRAAAIHLLRRAVDTGAAAAPGSFFLDHDQYGAI